MNNKVFLISTDDVKAASQTNYNVDDSVLAGVIRTAQNIYLRDIIGDNLLEALQDMVSENTIDNEENIAYKELLDNYIFDYLAYKANVELCVPVSLKLRNIGLSQDSDTNILAASLQGIDLAADFYETQAIDKCNRMIDFITENRDAFPEVDTVCTCGKQAPNLRKRANTRLWIGA